MEVFTNFCSYTDVVVTAFPEMPLSLPKVRDIAARTTGPLDHTRLPLGKHFLKGQSPAKKDQRCKLVSVRLSHQVLKSSYTIET